jgi:thioredoxin 1
MSKVITVTKDNIDEIVSTKKLVILDFWATWCGPCKIYSPIIDSFADQNTSDEVLVGKVDCDQEKELIAKYSIKSIPTTVIIHSGEVVDKRLGVVSESDLNEILLKYSV